MGTTAMVANSTIRLSPGWNAVFYFSQVQDSPYLFLLLVGVALVRKPGCVFCDLYIVARLGRVFGRSATTGSVDAASRVPRQMNSRLP
jgi:hypothetical protein